MKKHLETINEVVNLLATHNDGYMRTAHTSPNVFAFIRENPQDTKGLFKITITTATPYRFIMIEASLLKISP